MRQSIETKYMGPTNNLGSRVKAISASGHTLTTGWDHALSPEENHKAAMIALCKKLGWKGTVVGGSTKEGFVFVFVDNCEACVIT